MREEGSAQRLQEKSLLHAIQVELQQGYDLSPVEAQVLARRVQQLVDEQLGQARQPGQVTYQATACDEPPGKPLRQPKTMPKFGPRKGPRHCGGTECSGWSTKP